MGKWKLALVPLEMWEEFSIRVRKEFERQNPNTCFDSWVREPAKDVELQVGKAGIRWYIPQYFLAWSKIPVKKGTLLYLYRAHLWIIISLTEQHSDAIPNNSSNIPDCSSITPDPS